jgi:Na+/proline symporter/signal transduction histidine kinase
MTFDVGLLFVATAAYLLLLFLVAYAAERGWIPSAIARHPATYALSLGVYATSWSYYGSVGFAQTSGFGFLTIYLGVTFAFLLTPVLLRPILRLVREYQLTSIADVFAIRYRSQWTGVLVTLFMLVAVLPYLALQIRAVSESMQVLTHETTPAVIGLGFCVLLILFAILFGARHITPREKHEGLVVAIAFESLIKLTALLAVGGFAVFGVFGGFGGLNDWLAANPQAMQALYEPARNGPWITLLVLAFAAAFLLPRQFHMTFTENIDPRTLTVASWAFPLFLLALNLAIPPILWAGQAAAPATRPDYYVLGITLTSGSSWLPTLAFLGGVSAASAMMIVETLALAAMCLNHLILPLNFLGRGRAPAENLYRWLLWGRRALIALIVMAGYAFYLVLERKQGLVELGLISFVAVAQCLPGIVGLLYWPRATRAGFIAGLSVGAGVWLLTVVLPLLDRSGVLSSGVDLPRWLGVSDVNVWSFSTFLSLSLNAVVFVVVSLATRQTAEEQDTAHACCRETLTFPRGVVAAGSPDEFREQLSRIVGSETAAREVRLALEDLGLGPAEQRPAELRRLRERIERNLSGLVGPLLARTIVDERLRMDPTAQTALADSMRYLEDRLEDSRLRLQGLAAELDALRRYHRRILQELPIGVCSLGPTGEVVIWNQAMQQIAGLDTRNTTGIALAQLPEPWGGLLSHFAEGPDEHLYKLQAMIRNQPRWFNLHKAAIDDPALAHGMARAGTVLLVEDLTERHTLEAELAHTDRLASIGRLAAGVAHEIGNPLTGIACLAQNLQHEHDASLMHDSVTQIQQQIRRISDIVQSLVTFSHAGRTRERADEIVPVSACLDDAMRLVRLSHAGKQIRYENRVADTIAVRGEYQRLLQVFVNLLTNACDASQPGKAIEIDARVANERAEIEVIDHGSGIPEELLGRVFEPFFTTKQPGEGTGLGLPLVYSIIQDHGGSVTITSRVGEGTRVMLRLPCAHPGRERSRT